MYVRGLTSSIARPGEHVHRCGRGFRRCCAWCSDPRRRCSRAAARRRDAGSDARTVGRAGRALWIHLWAVTAAIVVLLPRTLLAALALFHERRLARRALAVELLAGSFACCSRRIVAPAPRSTCCPTATASPGVRPTRCASCCTTIFGLRADVRVRDALPPRRRDRGRSRRTVRRPRRARWSCSASCSRPSARCTDASRASCSSIGGDRVHVLAVVDSSAWHRASRGRRRAARRAPPPRGTVCWKAGLAPLHVNLASALETDVVEQAEARLGRAHGEGS